MASAGRFAERFSAPGCNSRRVKHRLPDMGAVKEIAVKDRWDDASDPLEEFIRAHQPTMLRVAYLLTGGDQVRADDVVQAVWVRLHAAGTWKAIRDPGGYLHRAVVNEWRTQLKSNTRFQHDEEPVAGASGPILDEAAVDTRMWVWDALEVLPERQRAAIILRYYLDLDDRDTARALGCTRATVRSLIHRALPKIARELDDHETAAAPTRGADDA